MGEKQVKIDNVKQLNTFDWAVYTFGMYSVIAIVFRFFGHGINGLDRLTVTALILTALSTAIRWTYKRYR